MYIYRYICFAHRFTPILKRVVLNYATLRRYLFPERILKTDNLKRISSLVNSADRKEFFFDLSALDWYKLAQVINRGLRKLLKEPLEPTPATLRKYRNLKILHYTVVGLIVLILLNFFYWITSNIFSLLA